jgi:hypothetical protein
VTIAFKCALEVALEASLGLLLLFSPFGSGRGTDFTRW